jgi:hypothetical protein
MSGLASWCRRFGLVLAGSAIAGLGCVTSRIVHGDDLHPGDSFSRSVVFLKAGAQYEFVRLAVFPDTLVGEYEINMAREEANHNVYYEDVTHALHMDLATVDSVAVLRRDSRKTFLYGVGLAGGAVLIYELINAGSPRSD